jgi:hypothetical protein
MLLKNHCQLQVFHRFLIREAFDQVFLVEVIFCHAQSNCLEKIVNEKTTKLQIHGPNYFLSG